MKKLNRKQIFIIITIGILIVLSITLLIYFNNRKPSIYPSEPITQDSLGNDSQLEIDIEGLFDDQDREYKLFKLSNKTELEKVEDMVFKIDDSVELTNFTDGEYYYWSNTDSTTYFQYVILTNTLTFSMDSGINWDEAELTENSFHIFINKYFDKDWSYEITNTLSFNDNATIYYAKRKIYENLLIETGEIYNETDYLMMDNGKIVAGRLLLTNFIDTQEYIPVVNIDALKTFINAEAYPKSVYFNPGKTADILSIDDEYLNEELLEIQENINRCSATNINIVYLYQSFDQQYLTPVYKVGLDCTVEYKNETYSIPATSFVNAVDPEYIIVQ